MGTGALGRGPQPICSNLGAKGTNSPTSVFSHLEAKGQESLLIQLKEVNIQDTEQSEEGWRVDSEGPMENTQHIHPLEDKPSPAFAFKFKSIIMW